MAAASPFLLHPESSSCCLPMPSEAGGAGSGHKAAEAAALPGCVWAPAATAEPSWSLLPCSSFTLPQRALCRASTSWALIPLHSTRHRLLHCQAQGRLPAGQEGQGLGGGGSNSCARADHSGKEHPQHSPFIAAGLQKEPLAQAGWARSSSARGCCFPFPGQAMKLFQGISVRAPGARCQPLHLQQLAQPVPSCQGSSTTRGCSKGSVGLEDPPRISPLSCEGHKHHRDTQQPLFEDWGTKGSTFQSPAAPRANCWVLQSTEDPGRVSSSRLWGCPDAAPRACGERSTWKSSSQVARDPPWAWHCHCSVHCAWGQAVLMPLLLPK